MASWQNWAWSNPVAWLCCWKSCSSTAGWGDFALRDSAKSYSSHSIPSLQTWQPWPCYQARAGQCQHCWHLYLVGPDRGTDPPKDVFVYFKVLWWQHAQECPQVIENKVKPKYDGGERRIRDHQPLLASQTQVQRLLHSTYTPSFLAQGPGALPKSLWFVETDCQAGEIPWLKRSGTLTHCILCREVVWAIMPGEERGQPERKSVQWSLKCVLIAEGGLFAAPFSLTLGLQKENLEQVSVSALH